MFDHDKLAGPGVNGGSLAELGDLTIWLLTATCRRDQATLHDLEWLWPVMGSIRCVASSLRVREVMALVDLKMQLWAQLRGSRSRMLARLEGLSEYDRRRPLTPTGTNLLGLIKHLAGLEYGYLGASFGRPPAERPSWFRDDPYAEIDMWATPDESSDYIISVYGQACAHSDVTIGALELDSPGQVEHWSDGAQGSTLGELLILMAGETAQHAGHADIVRELIDGRIGVDGSVDANSAFWAGRRDEVQAVADLFR